MNLYIVKVKISYVNGFTNLVILIHVYLSVCMHVCIYVCVHISVNMHGCMDNQKVDEDTDPLSWS